MRRTHLSLYYLIGYVVPSGLLLFFAPAFTTQLLFSNQVYSEPALRLAGLVLLALGIFVIRLVRLHVEVMYTTTLIVRSLLSVGLLYLFASTGNPFFAIVLATVLFGVALTGTSYLLDRRDAMARLATA